MPQKANPIASEVVLGMSSLAAQQVPALLAAMRAGHERAAGEWQIEWDALPTVVALAAGSLANTREILSGLSVYPDRMRANLDIDGGTIMAERVMIRLATQIGRATAHDLVYEVCSVARDTGIGFRDAIVRTLDSDLVAGLEPLDDLLDPESYLGETGAVVDAALEIWAQRSDDIRHARGRIDLVTRRVGWRQNDARATGAHRRRMRPDDPARAPASDRHHRGGFDRRCRPPSRVPKGGPGGRRDRRSRPGSGECRRSSPRRGARPRRASRICSTTRMSRSSTSPSRHRSSRRSPSGRSKPARMSSARNHLALDLGAAQRIVDRAAQLGRKVAVQQQLRFEEGIAATRAMTREGWIGEPTAVSFSVDVQTDFSAWSWLVEAPKLEIYYHSIHYLDAIRALIGEPLSVFGTQSRRPGQIPRGETRTISTLIYPGDLRAVVHANHENLSGDNRAEFQVDGTGGTIRGTLGLMYDYPRGRPDTLEIWSSVLPTDGWLSYPVTTRWIPDAFIGPVRSLLAAIATGGEPETSARDNLGTLEDHRGPLSLWRDRRQPTDHPVTPRPPRTITPYRVSSVTNRLRSGRYRSRAYSTARPTASQDTRSTSITELPEGISRNEASVPWAVATSRDWRARTRAGAELHVHQAVDRGSLEIHPSRPGTTAAGK